MCIRDRENGLSMSVKELEELCGADAMITEEFRQLVSGVKMNRPVEVMLAQLGERSGIQDVDNFAQVFTAARRSGGELVEIIGYTAGIIRDKVQVQEEIHTMTAARVFEQKIMNGIPFAIILYIDVTSPGFFHMMYTTWAGRAVMTVCLFLYGAAVIQMCIRDRFYPRHGCPQRCRASARWLPGGAHCGQFRKNYDH